MWRLGASFLPATLLLQTALAIGQIHYVTNTYSPGSFSIVQDKSASILYVDTNDFAGVVRAAHDLQADVARVTGCTPAMTHDARALGSQAILIGTIGKSPTIDRLITDHKIDAASIAGQWESYLIQVVPKPWPGVASSLVVAGSDKRGTIYGIYDLSEQMGVSPWFWWANVPVRHRENLFVRPGKFTQGPPAVKYRGIFLNDEAPSLTGWVKEKYGDYNHAFYADVFELLLRLRANYLWPAMWDNCFNQDDPLNPELADEYGIVMGTSHVEPMMRADKEWSREGHTAQQWNYATHADDLLAFWKEGLERTRDYERIITIAMRGKVDTPMSPTANIALLERIVAAQRNLISEVMHTNAASVPQLWALYKEVQEYYEKGMRVPDDVTLLWCDDNWGNIRRLPTAQERLRRGGAGVYYHFDYVGGPRNYKWLNTVPITKVWEQMDLAYHYGADRIWIVNVGDLKPMEFPMEFFLTFAWDPQKWPKEKLAEYTRLWAEREFGPEHAEAIADIVSKYTKYNGRRKPELLEPGTFSLVNYQEGDSVLADWKAITEKAEQINRALPENARDAFFELVLYPTKACEQVNELYITVAKNRQYANQGRASANDLAAEARALFKADAELSDFYNHTLAHGKWNHMMDQTHVGYTYWQQPASNAMPKVVEVELAEAASLGVAPEGSAAAWLGSPLPSDGGRVRGEVNGSGEGRSEGGTTAQPPEAAPLHFDCFSRQTRFIDVFNRGRTPFAFEAEPNQPWITLSKTNGTIEKEQRLDVSVDWGKAPRGSVNGFVKISGASGQQVSVPVNVSNPREPKRNSLEGFVENDGYVSIEAAHYTRKTDAGNARWEPIPDYGRTLCAMTLFPVSAPSVTPPRGAPCLAYRMFLFNTGAVEVTTLVAPSLNFAPDRGVRLAASFDSELPQILTIIPKGYFVDNGVRDWEESVKDTVRKVKSRHIISKPGYHTLKLWMVDPGVVIEKIMVDLGGLKPSYLGPPESYRHS